MTVEGLADPSQSALLVVDMQNDFCDSNGAIARQGGDVSLIQGMAPRLLRLLEAARQIKLPIIHVRTLHSPWTNSESWLTRPAGAGTICFPGSWGADYYPGFAPRSSEDWVPGSHEYVVTKHRYSAFVGTDLDVVLRSQGIRTLVMTGEATNVCVESTARDGFMRDYRIAYVSDCTATVSKEAHEAALAVMGRYFGTVVTAERLLSTWRAAGVEADSLPV